MIALAGALGGFHLPQQRIHLRQAEPPMGVNGAAAGERPQHAMRGAVQMVRTTLAGQIAQDFTQERWQVGPREHGPHRPHSSCVGESRSISKPKAGEVSGGCQERIDLMLAALRAIGSSRRCAAGAPAACCNLKLSYRTRSCAACMSTSTSPARFWASTNRPWSCAMAVPSGRSSAEAARLAWGAGSITRSAFGHPKDAARPGRGTLRRIEVEAP